MSRTNKTKELLAQSLTELMVTTPLEKISVNDIVEHAGVGRNTFYYHFEDKFDLVNWYFQSGATQFLVTRGHYASWSTLLTDLEEYLLQNKTFYVNALAYTGQNCLHTAGRICSPCRKAGQSIRNMRHAQRTNKQGRYSCRVLQPPRSPNYLSHSKMGK